MKMLPILFLLLWVSPAFGQLTKEDLRTILKEEITASEKRTREYIDLKVDGLEKSLNVRIDATNARIGELDKNLNARIDGLEKSLNARIDATNARIDALDKSLNARIDDVWIMMIALVGLIAAAIAVPQIIIAYKERGQKEMQRQIDQPAGKI